MHAADPSSTVPRRAFSIGAEKLPDGRFHYRVWAPHCSEVQVILFPDPLGSAPGAILPLQAETEAQGYHSGYLQGAVAGMSYKIRLADGEYADIASRFQPRGPHGPSQLVDSYQYQWGDASWDGVSRAGQVIYEMHIGTFTPEGTWAAAATQLPQLADLGITLLEIMPVADFSGQYGWGYDGVNLFAPTHLYGTPDDFRAFVDRAHQLGLGVILDVVYNHIGPDGNYFDKYSPDYFTDRYKCEWGEPINFDGPNSGPVREYFLTNVAYWIREFHLDGLRLDATQQIFDNGAGEHILAALTRTVKEAGGKRHTYVVAENECQHSQLVRHASCGGYDMEAIWNDDFHHCAIVTLTGKKEAYFTDYKGTPQEFISIAKWGFLYQGQYYKWQKKRRGMPSLDVPSAAFVSFIENHDQVANSLWGRRIHTLTSAGRLRAMTALLLLGPATPMLFQGQEFGASSPFLYFADHTPELAAAVAKGRAEFLAQFPSIAAPEVQALLASPGDEKTFLRCKLDFADRERHAPLYRLHRDLLRLRREDPYFGKATTGEFDGAVLGDYAFLLRFFGRHQDDRLVIVNLDKDLDLDTVPEPLLAPPDGHEWTVLWSSEDPSYGGGGTAPIETPGNWHLPAESAVVLQPIPLSPLPPDHECNSQSKN